MSHRSQRGQGLAEYALVLALVVIIAVLVLVLLSDTINTMFSKIGNSI